MAGAAAMCKQEWQEMEQKIEIVREGGDRQGAYRAQIPGIDAHAELTWHRDGEDNVVASHTYTPPEMRGRGIAGQLVRALVEDARAGGFRIVPNCPYVGDWFDRHPEAADLRA